MSPLDHDRLVLLRSQAGRYLKAGEGGVRVLVRPVVAQPVLRAWCARMCVCARACAHLCCRHVHAASEEQGGASSPGVNACASLQGMSIGASGAHAPTHQHVLCKRAVPAANFNDVQRQAILRGAGKGGGNARSVPLVSKRAQQPQRMLVVHHLHVVQHPSLSL